MVFIYVPGFSGFYVFKEKFIKLRFGYFSLRKAI